MYKRQEGDSVTTDYCGNVVYENGVPQILLTEVGYVSLTDGKYHYYLKDHQGNNRVVVDEEGTVEEVNHYYPFGGVFSSTGDAQPYKYNGCLLYTSTPCSSEPPINNTSSFFNRR